MIDYKKLFLKTLREGTSYDLPEPSNQIQTGKEPNDNDVWKQSNPGIAGNEDINGQFEVEGLPVDMMENYFGKINGWRSEFEQMTNKLEEVYKFAASSADKPGASEIFSSIGNLVEGIMTDLGTLNGQLRSLGEKIRVMMNRENKKKGGVD